MSMDSRKQAMSIRMSAADIRSIKRLAKRLGVRDSDVIRFAVKTMLTRFGPLADGSVRGRNLVPVFAEIAAELFRYLDIDVARLEGIINDGVEPAARMDLEDIQLMAMSATHQSYAMLRLSRIGSHHNGDTPSGESEQLSQTLRRYLYEKYGYAARVGGNGVADQGEAA